jgi:hypothetical protein
MGRILSGVISGRKIDVEQTSWTDDDGVDHTRLGVITCRIFPGGYKTVTPIGSLPEGRKLGPRERDAWAALPIWSDRV